MSRGSRYLDDFDRKIIGVLQVNGRLSNSEIARQLGASPGTIRNRIDRLVKTRAIQIVAAVDPQRLGLGMTVLIGLRGTLSRLSAIEEALSTLSEVSFLGVVAGRYDFIVGATFATDSEFRSFLQNKLAKIGGIKSTETFPVISVVKRLGNWGVPRDHPIFASVRTPGHNASVAATLSRSPAEGGQRNQTTRPRGRNPSKGRYLP